MALKRAKYIGDLGNKKGDKKEKKTKKEEKLDIEKFHPNISESKSVKSFEHKTT